ncbi:MAG: hypothetical protein ACKVXR_02300 [Planctomycetota bacterium]
MSSGERIPIVFYPRYSVLTASPSAPATSTSTTYYTTPMDMLGFSAFSITAFRSTITGGAIAIATDWTFEESSDLNSWDPTSSAFDPGTSGNPNVGGETQRNEPIVRRYVRLKIVITSAADASMTLFAIGWAERTTS